MCKLEYAHILTQTKLKIGTLVNPHSFKELFKIMYK